MLHKRSPRQRRQIAVGLFLFCLLLWGFCRHSVAAKQKRWKRTRHKMSSSRGGGDKNSNNKPSKGKGSGKSSGSGGNKTKKKKHQQPREQHGKKKKLRSALDTIKRILHDPELPTRFFTFGYKDRHLGRCL